LATLTSLKGIAMSYTAKFAMIALSLFVLAPGYSHAGHLTQGSVINRALQPIAIYDVLAVEAVEVDRDRDSVTAKISVKLLVEGNIKSGDPSDLVFFRNLFSDCGCDPETLRLFAKKKLSQNMSDGHEMSRQTEVVVEFEAFASKDEPHVTTLISLEREKAKIQLAIVDGTPVARVLK
jgi:hypothetical protein